MIECAKGFSSKEPSVMDEGLLPQPYQYGVILEFEPGMRDAFMNSPNFRNDYHTISNTIGEMMNDTLVWEMARDQDDLIDYFDRTGHDSMPPDQFDELMTGIHDNTLDDADITMQDLSGILRQTFPDSGIVGAKLSYIEGANDMCRAPNPEEVMQASAPDMDGDLLADMPATRPALTALKR